MIRISSDSTCDLSPDIISRFGIHVIPLSIVLDNEVFRDGLEITPSDLYSYVDDQGKTCQTAAVNVWEYSEQFAKLSKDADAVIHISLGSDFSSSYQNAKLAADQIPNVYVIDSQNLSTGIGYLVYEAALMAKAGLEPMQICEQITSMVSQIETSFVLDRLDYIAKGGRCSAVTAQGARILRLKASIEVADGRMIVGAKYRGKLEKCLQNYVRDRLEGRTDLDLRRIFVTHSGCSPEIVAAVKAEIREYAGFEEVVETSAGCTIANHCGPNTLGIIFKKA